MVCTNLILILHFIMFVMCQYVACVYIACFCFKLKKNKNTQKNKLVSQPGTHPSIFTEQFILN